MDSDLTARFKMAAAVLVALVGLVGLGAAIWHPKRAPVATPKRPTTTVNRVAPTAIVVPPPEARTSSEPSSQPPSSGPDAVAEATPASLEDVISRAMPAVVRVETPGGVGSAFFVKRDTLLTNVHVVAGHAVVTVHLSDGRAVQGRVDATAPDYDLAIVKVADSDGSPAQLPLGSALRTRVGQEIVALGSPFGLQNTVTRGIVSALRQVGSVMLVQTDAAINPGNSGGPLVDRSGRVVAIATMRVKPGEGQGLSFGVAAENAQALLDGRLPTASADAPLAGIRELLAPQPPAAGGESVRDLAERAFQQTLARVAQDADALDDRWRSFVGTCYRGPIGGGFDRPWFALFDARAMRGAVPSGCEGAFSALKQAADRVRDAILAADEAARRADVYPGARRDALRRQRLDYAGWSQ
ncbi:MAG TPA: trypsin-like peptidase domain-containing protein [Vicinamibacterales bacterium]|jgi:S1-C subfamily serine protease|nr:trypsin-like peptidase domain-containing protein [Vicinamibacterales bacterium]